MKYLRKSWVCLILIFLIGVVIPTKTEAAEASTLRIVNATYPTVLKQGQSFTVGGIAVSYTHLDVYKRQHEYFLSFPLLPDALQ